MKEGYYWAKWAAETEIGDEQLIVKVGKDQRVAVIGSGVGYPTHWFAFGPRVQGQEEKKEA